jgi:uncharacterized protein
MQWPRLHQQTKRKENGMTTRFLMIPGIGGSDAKHWQSVWEAELGADRIAPASWREPEESDWHDAIGARVDSGTVLVAHSLGCLAAASWLVRAGAGSAAGVMLVSPPDTNGPVFPAAASSFSTPSTRLPVPSLVVAGSNDPYADLATSQRLAAAWGAARVDVGALGHINSDSGLGRWEQGLDLLTAFVAGLGLAPGEASRER